MGKGKHDSRAVVAKYRSRTQARAARTRRNVRKLDRLNHDRRQGEAQKRRAEFCKRYPTYEHYLNSPEWWTRRREAYERAGRRCENCGHRGGDKNYLSVHHKTYVRLGCEWPSDLEVLCKDCHKAEHM